MEVGPMTGEITETTEILALLDSEHVTLGADVDTRVDADEAFLELICADDDLLRAEFEAIVAASWVGPPDRPRPVPTPRPPASAAPMGRWLRAKAPTALPVPTGPGDGQRGRERSPPTAGDAIGTQARDGEDGDHPQRTQQVTWSTR